MPDNYVRISNDNRMKFSINKKKCKNVQLLFYYDL